MENLKTVKNKEQEAILGSLEGLRSTKSTYRLNQIARIRANGVGDHIPSTSDTSSIDQNRHTTAAKTQIVTSPKAKTKCQLDIESNQQRYEVERILDSAIIRRKIQYLVKWKGYDEIENKLGTRIS